MRTLQGSCHCTAFRFTVNFYKRGPVYACNCSICSKKGYLWVYPFEKDITIERNELPLTDYEFEPKTMVHSFCSKCGTGLMSKWHGRKPGGKIGVNARSLLGVNVWSLDVKPIDGKRHDPQYIPPVFRGPIPEADGDDSNLYTGSCHCGAVKLAFRSKPLENLTVKEDDCTICTRNAYLIVEPPLSHVSIEGLDKTTSYEFATMFQEHRFCKTCGVPVFIKIHDPHEKDSDDWSEEKKRAVRDNFGKCPINSRILNGVELEKLKVERVHGGGGK